MDKIIFKVIYYWKHYRLGRAFIVLLASLFIDFTLRTTLGNHEEAAYVIYSLRVLYFVAVILTLAINIMDTYYRDKTDGRSCFRDMKETGRPYYNLLNYYKDANPYKLKVNDYPRGTWKHCEGVILGKYNGHVICRSAFEKGGQGQNYALYAVPGAGKTTSQIIPSCLRWGGSVFALDIKGDIYNATHSKRRIKVFSPDDPKNSCHYNPLGNIGTMTMMERKIYLEQMASVIVPEDKENKYWHETARNLFVGISLYCLNENVRATLPEISQKILEGNAVDWVMTIKDGDCVEAQQYTNSMYGSSEKNISGAYAELAKNVRLFASENLAELLNDDGDTLSPEVLEHEDLYLILPQDKYPIYLSICSLMFADFITYFQHRSDITSGKTGKPILFCLDEFYLWQIDYDFILSALASMRSKKISIFICCQSIGQLSDKYGEKGFQAIMDCCQTISVMSAQDPASRQYFQSLIGTKKELRLSTNTGGAGNYLNDFTQGIGGRSVQEVREPIFQPEDFANFADKDKVLIYINGKYILADKTPWYL